MSTIVTDIETTSLFLKDGKTKNNDIKTLMITYGEVMPDDTLKMKTMYANGYDDIPEFYQRMSSQFTEYKPAKIITFNGVKFDIPVLRRGFVDENVTGRPFKDAIHVDVYNEMIMPNMFFGTAGKTKSLKTLSERWLGFKYEMDGKDFFKMYDEWLLSGDDEILMKLIEYNQDDVKNTWDIYQRLIRFIPPYWSRGKQM